MKILFVCTGNICRSPTAEAVFKHLAQQAGIDGRITVESCGLGGWHIGEPPDERSQKHAARRGYDLSGQRARQIRPDDFETFDLVLAMDRGHLRGLLSMAPPDRHEWVKLFLDFAGDGDGQEVPDPYYGAADGFETVLDLVEAGSRGLLKDVRGRLDG